MQLSLKRSANLKIISCAIAAVLMLAGRHAAVSQITTAAIHGTVTDPSGAVVPNAKIAAVNTSTGIETDTTSNGSGFYVFPTLQIGGPYTVTIDATGFTEVKRTGIMLTVNANLEENAALKVGISTQVVSVDASQLQVETANTQLQQIVNATQIENLPILERDASGLEKLTPGVVEASDDTGAPSVNGSQNGANSYRLEGIDINDFALQDEGFSVNPDALQEFNVVTSTINPEFARNSGSIINETIKAGSNQIHGSGFEYYRDTFMNLPGYFALPGERTPFHQNLYGATLGGPIVKNKLFGFLAYQGFRRRTGTIQETPIFQSGIMPSSTSPGGDFSNENNIANSGPNGVVGLSTNPIPFDITTGAGAEIGPGMTCGPSTTAYTTWATCFPAGTPVVINPTSFNSLASTLATTYVPQVRNAGTDAAPLYNFPTANTGAQDQGILRADYHISDRDSIYGVGLFQSSPSLDSIPFGYNTGQGANLPGFSQINAEHLKLFSGTETHTFNSNTINVLRAGYYRLNYAAVEPAHVVDPASVGFSINPQSPSAGLPVMALTGLFNLGFSSEGPQPRKDTNLNFSDDFTHLIGNHSLKFGATVEQFRVSNPYYADNNGVYSYAGNGTYSSGDPGIDFLLGIPDSYNQQSGAFIDTIAYEYYAYAQDSWHATHDLTLNYGVGWDVETPTNNRQYKGVGVDCFEPGTTVTSTVYPGAFPGLLYPGDPGCNDAGGATPKWAHFGPRFGFAWAPSNGPAALIGGPGRFSIRGGFGLYYNRDIEEGQLQNLGDPPILLASHGAADLGAGYSPAFANPFTDVAGNGSEPNPFPYVLPPPGSTLTWSNYLEEDMSAISPAYGVPYVYNFNLNIQRQLPGNMILQVGYVGSIGHRLVVAYDGDPITGTGQAACAADPTCVAHASQQRLYYPSHALETATTGGIPDYLDVGVQDTEGSSNYNSLQASLVNNTWHGLYFSLAYTYSHALDDDSGLTSSGFNARGRNTVPGYRYLNYGDSDFDARHRLAASYDYRIPLLASMNQNYLVKETLGDWHVDGFTILQTGFPVLIEDGGIFNSLWCDSFAYYGCPDDVNSSSSKIATFDPRSNLGPAGHQYFDTTPFSQEAVGTFGNVRRNPFHGPGFNYTNLSLFKNIPLGHDAARSLQIMLQAANVFNHANFGNPDGNYTDGKYFGAVTALWGTFDYDENGDPTNGRTAQIVAKIKF